MTSPYDELITQWGIDRNILGPTGEGTKHAQKEKTYEELCELSDAIRSNDLELARDAIGDIYVTLVMQAALWDFTMDECIAQAWHQIKDRKGKMVNGVFVKEAV